MKFALRLARRKEAGSATRTATGRRTSLQVRQDELRFWRKREIISGRHADGSQFAIKLGGDESSPEDLSFAFSCGRLHIQGQKSMKDVISEEGYKQEALDGAGLVHVDMIGVPFVGQLVEAIILDVPSLVS